MAQRDRPSEEEAARAGRYTSTHRSCKLIAGERLGYGDLVIDQGEVFTIGDHFAVRVFRVRDSSQRPLGPAMKDYAEGDEVGIVTKVTRGVYVEDIPGLTLPPLDIDLSTLIDSVTEHSGPAHILPGPHVEEVVREVLAAEDIEAEDLVYLKPDGTVGLSYGTKRRRERDRMLWEDLFREVRRMAEVIEEPAPEPPGAEAEGEPEGLSSDGLTWRQQPGLL